MGNSETGLGGYDNEPRRRHGAARVYLCCCAEPRADSASAEWGVGETKNRGRCRYVVIMEEEMCDRCDGWDGMEWDLVYRID